MLCSRVRAGWIGLLLTAILCTPGASARAQTTLRYQFKEGEKLAYAVEQKMSMHMNVNGQEVQVTSSQTMDIALHIKSVDKNGKAKIGHKFERIRFSVDSPMVKTEFDSREGTVPEGPIGEMIGPLFKAMTGAEFTMTMDSQGKVSNIQLPDKVTKALKSSSQLASMGEMFSEDGLKHMVEQIGVQLPAAAVTKGQSWNQTMEMKMPFGTMKVDNAFTYEGPTTRGGKMLEQMAVKPKITIEPSGDSPISVKLKDQDAKGTGYFDNTAGRMVEMNVTATMNMEISAAGQNIAQKIEQTVTMKLVDQGK